MFAPPVTPTAPSVTVETAVAVWIAVTVSFTVIDIPPVTAIASANVAIVVSAVTFNALLTTTLPDVLSAVIKPARFAVFGSAPVLADTANKSLTVALTVTPDVPLAVKLPIMLFNVAYVCVELRLTVPAARVVAPTDVVVWKPSACVELAVIFKPPLMVAAPAVVVAFND